MIYLFIALVIIFIIGYSISDYFIAGISKKIAIIPMALVVGLIAMGYSILLFALLSKSFFVAVWLFMTLGGAYSIYYIIPRISFAKEYLSINQIGKFLRFHELRNIPWAKVIFFLLFLVFFFDIFSKTVLYENGSYKVTVAGYGDIPFHMAEVSYFIHNNPFVLEEPIYAGTPLVYAFLINFLSAIFFVLSGNYILSFNLPAYILLISGFYFIYLFISFFIKRTSNQILVFLVFLLGAGSEYIKVFKDPALWSKGSLAEMADYILHLPYRIVNLYDAVYPAQNNIWSGFMTMFLMHQRSFFFGFAVGAMVLYLLFNALKNKDKKSLYFIAIIAGSLPLIHIHTFISFLVILAGVYLWAKFIAKEYILAGELFKTGVISVLIGAAITYFFIINHSGGSSFVTFRLGWMSEPGGIGSMLYGPPGSSPIWAWLLFLWENFGLFFPYLALALIYFMHYRRELMAKKDAVISLVFGAILLFVVTNLIKFQPWDYDNGKIIGYFYILGSIIIFYFFERLKFRFSGIIALVLALPLIFVGLIDTFSRSSLANPPLYEIFGAKEQKAAEWILENTSPGEMILTGTSHLNLIDSLAGRPVLVGYPGWLWSHGIQYGDREKDVKNIYSGAANAEKLLEKYNIRYVYIGPSERYDLKPNEQFFVENYPVVFQEGDIKIYRVR